MKTLRNIVKKLCNIINNIINKLFESQSLYDINIDDGLFKIAILGNHKTAMAGTLITIFRITDIPHNTMSPSIKVMNSDKQFIDVNTLSIGSEWSFKMPTSDIIIIPTIKRKY